MSSSTNSPTSRSEPARSGSAESADSSVEPSRTQGGDLFGMLAEVKGQAQFLLYLADQIEDSLQQLGGEADPGHAAFLCRVLSMYGNQLESKYHALGDKIGEASQEVYVTVREYDLV